MKIMYLAFANSVHTLKWVNYFKNKYEIMLVSFYESPPIDNVKMKYIPVANKNMVVFKVSKVKRLIDEFKPDILHAHYASSCGITAALTGFHPYILSVWGDDIFVFPYKSPLHRYAAKYAIKSASYVSATSRMLADGTRRIINDDKDIQVIPFGVDLADYHYYERQERDFVHIGTIRGKEGLAPKYGVEYLVRAAAELMKSGIKTKLTIVGDGPLRPELEILSQNLGMGDNINFAGYISMDQVPVYLNDFDIFVMPSVGRGETFGVAAVEAMATGLPVVGSRVGGLPEVIDDQKTGLLVEPANVAALAEALKTYARSADLRHTHGLAGRKKVENQYDWQQNAGLMNSLYQKAIGR